MTIDVHAHYVPEKLADALRQRTEPPWIEQTQDGERFHMPVGHLAFSDDYVDLDKRRDFMARHDETRQLLSFPGLFGLDSLPVDECGGLIRLFNDDLSAVCTSYPDQFSGLAALPFADMDQAVAEYRRARTELGLMGAILPVNCLVDIERAERLKPLFDVGQELGGHFFIHPGRRPDEVPSGPHQIKPRRFADNMAARQALAVQDRVSAAMVTLLFTDFLDAYPNISVHVANLGGTLPMVIERMDHVTLTRTPDQPLPSERAKKIHVDCSSLGPHSLEIAVDLYGADKVLFGTDCPIFSTQWSLDAVNNADLSDAQRRMILTKNAEKLLGG